MEYTAKHGGIIIYLNQEGRGIGLGNKIAAYKLQQEQGLDTVQANRALGLPDDVRKYEAVRDILKNLGVESIQLISNNPRKTDCLTKLGVSVTGTIPCVVQATHAPMQHYMQTKASAMGHTIPKSDAVKQGIIFIMGGPGSGKGTQCKNIANKTGYLHLSTGDIIRDLIKNPGSWDATLVAEVKAVTEHGDLIDDALTLKILKQEMARHPYACGFLLDGYPRTTEQARLFEEQVRPCDKVIFFDVTDAAMAARILRRSQGDTRADSSPETVRHRLDIYRQSTQPAIAYLRETHPERFVRIDGMGSIAEVSKQVEALFDKPVAAPVVSVGLQGMFAKEEKISQVDPVSGRNLANRPTYMI
jgi:adenylate kinase family enzyme